jgi:hypothetical protein
MTKLVIARSAATKQSSFVLEMDCFAALAMTTERDPLRSPLQGNYSDTA